MLNFYSQLSQYIHGLDCEFLQGLQTLQGFGICRTYILNLLTQCGSYFFFFLYLLIVSRIALVTTIASSGGLGNKSLPTKLTEFWYFDIRTHNVANCSTKQLDVASWCIISPYYIFDVLWATNLMLGQQLYIKFNQNKAIRQQKRATQLLLNITFIGSWQTKER